MLKNKNSKAILIVMLLVLVLAVLTGCVFTPPDENNNDPSNNTGVIPTINVPTQVPTPTTGVITLVTTAPTNAGVILLTTNTPVPVNTIPVDQSTPTVSPTFISITATPSPTPASLKLGASGEAVRDLQKKLQALGFYKGNVDGDYGAGTEQAVKDFQKQYGLDADGKAGSKTLSILATAKSTKKPTPTPTPKYTPTPKPTATPKANSYSNTYLKLGDSGSKVKQMQERLISLGYLSGKATGNFDSTTQKAVTAFQRRNTSYSDGIAGPDTLSVLYSTKAKGTSTSAGTIGVSYRNGDSGDKVKAIQQKLKDLGYFKGTCTGTFGTQTEEAVRAFQKKNGLTADGIVGTGTMEKLYSSNAIKAGQTPTPKPTKTPTPRPTATVKHTPTVPPNTYVRVTKSPNQKYINLYEGNYGTPVEELQRALKNQGYFSGNVDGYYGEQTTAAVKRFQKAKGLTQDGIAGFATQTVLFEGAFPEGS